MKCSHRIITNHIKLSSIQKEMEAKTSGERNLIKFEHTCTVRSTQKI